ncbi:metallophosphoesterase family protein [Sphaerisporangium sp. TRM90804]|uniref:metallophosphoesterase family protein n=1 Tax=Sphaerisporangium sp. TRM90804 TaxID=3031113 RepID=UPI002447ECC8|nr:metallophosphoesterase family protein [Sphaerisporangium sp. TRM90804]MDH2426094.1 metallophosphoesterase family protein [Sphaerisporangium sp. TRM90804]
MRVAVLSDIHGVLPALEAVLAEPDVAGADLIALTGDVAAGPQPVETLDLLVSLGERALWVNGNADRELVEVVAGKPSVHAVSQWAGESLRPDQVALLAALPAERVLDLGRLGTTLFLHATPRRDDEIILVDSTLDRWAEVLDGVTAGTVVLGNTHMPFVRLVDRRLVVNPGSVGMPYGTAGAHWALLDSETGAVTLRRTPLDAEEVARRLVAESGFDDVAAWAAEYVTSTYSDTEAIRVFGAAEGRRPAPTA